VCWGNSLRCSKQPVVCAKKAGKEGFGDREEESETAGALEKGGRSEAEEDWLPITTVGRGGKISTTSSFGRSLGGVACSTAQALATGEPKHAARNNARRKHLGCPKRGLVEGPVNVKVIEETCLLERGWGNNREFISPRGGEGVTLS